MSDNDREGPSVTIEASCFGCRYEKSEHYQAQSDSGCVVYCTHSSKPARIGDTTWDTPEWCPFIERVVLTKIGQVTGASYAVKGSRE